MPPGARFVTQSKVSRKLAEAITGKPALALPSPGIASEDRTWLSFRNSSAV
jgi:hypothetical protein